MKKLLFLNAVLLVAALSFFMAGCGGDDDQPAAGAAPVAAGNAPKSIAAKNYKLTATSGAAFSYTFTDTAFFRIEDGVTGTYDYTIKGNNQAGLRLTHADGEVEDLTLTFPTNESSGSYTGTTTVPGKAAEAVSGTILAE